MAFKYYYFKIIYKIKLIINTTSSTHHIFLSRLSHPHAPIVPPTAPLVLRRPTSTVPPPLDSPFRSRIITCLLPTRRRFHWPLATLSSSSPESSSASSTLARFPLSSSCGTRDKVVVDDNSPFARFFRSTEPTVERIIFDFRFLALLAVGGSLLFGCVYVMEAYKVYWTNCVKGIHKGQMVLHLVEAIDVYLAGTVMLIFSMGLY
ncbi:BnaC09g42950D [Brassica napus]|uniref:(rape) hypothetical protein n=1 Tax=Brassica napus TaxID=3708 RepID=A0A078F906_BRANA|nr:unnamed protein product [Brassica napus]CDY09866.1 BnaC09g42950D [Brassica napus]